MTGETELKLRTDDLVWQEVEGEIVVLDTRLSHYLAVKGSGALLWRQLAGGASRQQLSASLLETYGVTADRASADLDAFLASLTERGLLDA